MRWLNFSNASNVLPSLRTCEWDSYYSLWLVELQYARELVSDAHS